MAKTHEKRERIKWFYARSVFLLRPEDGLELAKLCEHEDARSLVSLFPGAAPATRAEAIAVLRAQGEEARCLCWASIMGAEPCNADVTVLNGRLAAGKGALLETRLGAR